jgi:FkbM family methyltransferase
VPATFAHLQATVKRLAACLHALCALGSSPGRGSFRLDPGDDRVTQINTDDSGAVAINTLDEMARQLGVACIDYLKIDTEGQDLAVLEGATRLLSAGAVAIIEVEAGMHRGNTVHVPASAFDSCLERFGYRLFGAYEQTLEWPTADAHLRRANLVFVSAETIRRNHWSSHGTSAVMSARSS